jgi:hypothetical protein
LAHSFPCSISPKAGTFAINLCSYLDWKQEAPQLVHFTLFFFPSPSTDSTDHFHPQCVRIVGTV